MALTVCIVHSPAPRVVHEVALEVPEGTTAAQALQLSGLLEVVEGLDPAAYGVGVWGRKAGPGQRLREGDRVEIYRPLTVDPKLARRERFRKQGARSTGLFARQRPGGKAGY